MARLAPKTETLRALFARSGNQCAFPGCNHHLINHKNQFVGQVCHIEGANEGGERFNVTSNDEERRSYDNLVLLCYEHHIETDDVEEFPVERLKLIKHEHEKMFVKNDFKISEATLFRIENEMNGHWAEVERLNTVDHLFKGTDLEMGITIPDGEPGLIFQDLKNLLNQIKLHLEQLAESDANLESDFQKILKEKNIDPSLFKSVPYYKNPFCNRNWETHYIGQPNLIMRADILFKQIQVLYYSEYLKTHPENLHLNNELDELKEELKSIAETAMYVD